MKRKKPGNSAFWPVCVIAAAILLFCAYAGLRSHMDERPHDSDISVADLNGQDQIRIPSAELPVGLLRLFRIADHTVAVKRLSDGRVHAALSSCTMCARQKNPSYARKNEMMCGYCNEPMRFENDPTRSTKPQCPMAEIPWTEKDGEITIVSASVADVAERARSEESQQE